MPHNPEHIKDLILFEITGHIGEHELAYLNALIEEYPGVALLRQQMIDKFKDPRLQARLERLDNFHTAFLKKIAKRKKRLYVNRRRRITKKRLSKRRRKGR